MPSKAILTSLALLFAAPLGAQEVVQALPGTTAADALAADMRRLASNPRDVGALVDAAQLSLKLGDTSAAAALLARAENVEPRNPKVKAGQGAILVQSERPGQALRYFAQAETGGLDPRDFAADRGLAFDLTGEQERAQRDYRLALRDRPNDDETIRRYALSLGISGQRQRALQLLDPLLRRSDRAAWRSQAFVLAMTGDVAGASKIAATMMPGGAAGLTAFFQRLPTLPAVDRAFAVHFGQVRATPQRLADARLAPPLPPLTREPGVLLASAQPLPPPSTRRNRRDRDTRTQIAATQPLSAPSVVRSVPAVRVPAPAPQRPAPQTGAAIAAVTATVPGPRPLPPLSAANVVSAPVSLAARPSFTPQASVAAAPPASSPAPGPASVTSRPPAAIASLPQPQAQSTVIQAAVQAAPLAPSAQPSAASQPVSQPIVPTPSPLTAQPVQLAALPPSAAVASVAPQRPPAPARMSEDSILAKIVASLSIPAAELGVEGPERPTPGAVPPQAPTRAEPQGVARAEADRASLEKLAVTRAAADKAAVDRAVAEKPAAKTAADKRAAERKAAADKKALADKKAAAEKKALADREAAEKRKVERANPERIWVQVAGGASERDLPKAYAAVKAKAPGVFGSRSGWTTPLRATNRVLAGPFKTDAEARKFVNDLKKEGVSAFTFTSDAGQPVKKLGG